MPLEHNRNFNYFTHLFFALFVSIRLLASSVLFALHAFLPFMPIPARLNLACTAMFLAGANMVAEGKPKGGLKGTKAVKPTKTYLEWLTRR
jgi:hypothetical protein